MGKTSLRKPLLERPELQAGYSQAKRQTLSRGNGTGNDPKAGKSSVSVGKCKNDTWLKWKENGSGWGWRQTQGSGYTGANYKSN